MDKIKNIFSRKNVWIVIVAVVVVTLLAVTAFSLTRDKSTKFSYKAKENEPVKIVFEYGKQADTSDITNRFALTYDNTVTVPKALTEEEVARVKSQGDYSYVKLETIDTSKVTHKIKRELFEQVERFSKQTQYNLVVDHETQKDVKSLKLEVYFAKAGTQEVKVAEEEIKYIVIDTVKPTITGTNNMTVPFGNQPDTSQIKASDPVDGSIEVTIDTNDFDAFKPGTYQLTAKAIDANGNEALSNFQVTVLEEVKETAATLPSTGDTQSSDSVPATNQTHGGNKKPQRNNSTNNNPGSNKRWF